MLCDLVRIGKSHKQNIAIINNEYVDSVALYVHTFRIIHEPFGIDAPQ